MQQVIIWGRGEEQEEEVKQTLQPFSFLTHGFHPFNCKLYQMPNQLFHDLALSERAKQESLKVIKVGYHSLQKQ